MVDRVEIIVSGGSGGHGAVSFRREKHVPFGGPDGGDGGEGGSVVIVADSATDDLLWFRRQRRFAAKRGGNGSGKKKHGRNGDDLLLKVPVGTVVCRQGGDNTVLADMGEEGQTVVIVKGGEGGLGNIHFATPSTQAPRIAQCGEAGEEASLILELKLIADVGIIGYPSVGKSTLLAAATAARPKAAGYPFTTCEPALGVVDVGQRRLVMAEIPGLIEGAHLGRGLGHDFLRHAERCKAIIHLLDGSSPSPVEDMRQVNRELSLFNPSLGQKSQIVAVNKVDLPQVRERMSELRKELAVLETPVFFISAMNGNGVWELVAAAARLVDSVEVSRAAMEKPVAVFRPKPRDDVVSVSREGNIFVVYAPELERMISRIDLTNPDGRVWLKKNLVILGVATALKKAGVKMGDRVCCGMAEWEWD